MVKYLQGRTSSSGTAGSTASPEVNQLLEQWMADVADRRELRQFRQTPEQRFTQEQEHLQPLPDTDFDTSYFDIRHVSWDGYIEVGGNRYSVPESLWRPAGINTDFAG